MSFGLAIEERGITKKKSGVFWYEGLALADPPGDLAEGEVAAYDVCETWVGLAEVEGEVYAIGDLCTHAGCSLVTTASNV